MLPFLFRSTWLFASVITLGAAIQAQNVYKYDDGTAEAALSFSAQPVDYAWFQTFDAVGGNDVIGSIQVSVGSDVPSGTPITLCVWEDISDLGDPSSWFFLTSVSGAVAHGGHGGFADYALATPASVAGRFVVGAFLSTDPSWSPATLDYGAGVQGVAYFSWNYSVGGFDPVNLFNNFPPTHIETLGAGIHGAFLLRAKSAEVESYCTAKTNSLGCVPHMGFSGIPSASSGSGFILSASNVLNQKTGLLFYGTSGKASLPFFGGTLCVNPPLTRTTVQGSGGSSTGDDCTGQYGMDFNVWIAAGADAALVAGAVVNAQYWQRDPGFSPPNNVGITDAVQFSIQP